MKWETDLEKFSNKFSKNLIRARKNSGLTQKEAAEKLFTTKTTICRYENGVRLPMIYSAYRLSKIYGVSLDKLCNGDFK